MPVNTPQLDMPVYKPEQMAVPPQPTGQPSQVLPAQAGYVSKAGAGAYVANNLIEGWLKGRAVKQQQEVAKAQNQLQGADYTYQTMAQNYNDLLRQGKAETDPAVQKAKSAAVQAWNAKLNVMQQYAMPEDQKGQKKGVKQKAANWFSQAFGKAGITPEIIPQASLAVLKSAQPPGLGLTLQDKQAQAQTTAAQAEATTAGVQGQEAQMRLQLEQQQASDQKQFRDAASTPPDQRTAAQKSFLQNFQRLQQVQLQMSDPQKAASNQAFQKLMAGQQMTATDRNLLYASGALVAPHMEITHDGLNEYATVFSPDGQVISKQKVGRQFHEDEAASLQRQLQVQNNSQYDEIARSLGIEPGSRDNAHVWQIVTTEQSKNPMLAASMLEGNPIQKEQDSILQDQVLRSLQQEASGPGVTAQERANTLNKWSNFYVTPAANDQNGYFQLHNPAVKENGTFNGGLNEKDLKKAHEAFINRFRAEVQKKKPQWSPQEVEDYLKRVTPQQKSAAPQTMQPPPSAQQAAIQGMQPQPGAQAWQIPGPGKRLYSVSTTQGPQKGYFTEDQVQAYQQAGADVIPVDQ